MSRATGKVVLTEAQRAALERLLVARKTPQGVVCRARIVLMSAGKSGVLNTRHTRPAFLADRTQRVRFVYTPALVLAESGGDLVQRAVAPTSPAEQLRVVGRTSTGDREVHRLLQRSARQAVPLDLPGSGL